MRARAMSVLLSVAAAAVALASLVAAPGARQPTGTLELLRTAGALVLADDHEGAAILQAGGLRPGSELSGEVTLSNSGSGPIGLVAAAAAESETPGLGGGRLSTQLQLAILDVSDPSAPRTVASGTLAALANTPAGTLAAGQARRLRVVATLPTSAGNDVQGASLAVGLTWTASGDEVTATPQPATTTPAPTTTPVTGAALTADQVVVLPSTRVCGKSPSLAVRLRRPAGVTLRSAAVYVNGRRAARAGGGALARPIRLRGLPRRALRVKVVVVTAAGERLQLTRSYRACR